MNPDRMRSMSASELDAYAEALGFSARAGRTADAKIKIIEERRGRAAELSVLGVQLSVPVKRAHDGRFSALLDKKDRTNDDVRDAFVFLLGEEQHAELVAAATDEDGTLDEAAIAYAYNALLDSRELKNF